MKKTKDIIINKKYRKAGFILLAVLILSTILGEGIIKHLVRQARPSEHILGVKMLIRKPSSYSFPSGHSTVAFASAVVLSHYFKKGMVPNCINIIRICYEYLFLSFSSR